MTSACRFWMWLAFALMLPSAFSLVLLVLMVWRTRGVPGGDYQNSLMVPISALWLLSPLVAILSAIFAFIARKSEETALARAFGGLCLTTLVLIALWRVGVR